MGFFDFIKDVGGKILGGLSKAGGAVLNIGNKVKDGISKGFDFVKKIPVIGDVVDTLASAPIIKGMSLKDLANKADTALQVGQSVKGGVDALRKGDIGGVINNAAGAFNNVQRLRGR